MKKNIAGVLVCLFLFTASILPSFEGSSQTMHAIKNTAVQQMNQQTATVSFYTFDKTRTQKHQIVLSLDDAMELYTLVKAWNDAKIVSPQTNDTSQLQRQLLKALDKYGMLSKDAMAKVIHSLSIPKNFQENSTASSQASCLLSVYGNQGTVLNCSISSNGSGLLIPMFLFPRPRIATFWIATSGTTFAVNIDTMKGFNATGPHLGVALGFIGIGISFISPGASHYVVVGHALKALLFGKNVSPYPPDKEPGV
jgi:hypothetical protein